MTEDKEWRLCPFCGAEPTSPCDDDCSSRDPQVKNIINWVRELLFLTEHLYKKLALDLPMDERHRMEDTINGVFIALGGIKK